MSSSFTEDQAGEAPAVLDPYGGQQLKSAATTANDLVQAFRDRQEILAQAAAVKQEIKEELLQEGAEYQWVPLADTEVSWDVLMAPPSEQNEAWAWVPQANDIESDDEGLVLWEAPDQEGLIQAWREIEERSKVELLKPVPKTRVRPPLEMSTPKTETLEMTEVPPPSTGFPKQEDIDRPDRFESLRFASAKAKTQNAKARRIVYQQPGAKAKVKDPTVVSDLPPPPPAPPPGKRPQFGVEETKPPPRLPKPHPKDPPVVSDVLPPPPAPPRGPPPQRATPVTPATVEEAPDEVFTKEEGESISNDAEDAAPMSEQPHAEEMSDRFKTLLLKSVDVPVPAEAKDIYEAAIFRQKLWEEMRKGPRAPPSQKKADPKEKQPRWQPRARGQSVIGVVR